RTKSLPALLTAAERDGRHDDRRTAPRDHRVPGDRHADGQQIGERRSARAQDADRHDERRRAQSRRRFTAARTAPAGRDGQGGGASARGAAAPADAAGDRRSYGGSNPASRDRQLGAPSRSPIIGFTENTRAVNANSTNSMECLAPKDVLEALMWWSR